MCLRTDGRNYDVGAENILPLFKKSYAPTQKILCPALNIYNTCSSAGFVFMPSST